MIRRLLPVILILLVFSATAQAADHDELIKRIDNVWMERGENTANMKEALSWAEQAYGANPGFNAAWRAARACFWICDRTEDRKVDLEYGLRGVEWAEKAIKANPGTVEGHYYYTLCLGEYGKGMSIVTALAKGLGGKFEASAQKAISIDGSYDQGAPYRALGRYYFKLPWPKYDSKKAEQNLLTSLKISPNQARTHFYLAELYIKEKQFDKAREIIAKQQAIKTPAPDSAFDDKYFKKLGSDILEQIKNQ